MNTLLQLVKFNPKNSQSHSILIDLQQIYIRNVILFCTGLSMARQLFGENIICQSTVKSLTQNFIDTKCYINGTITKDIENKVTIYHDYYQWISVYLLLLAFGFYFPYSIWSKFFGDYLRQLENLADKPNEAIQVITDSKGNLLFLKTWALEFFYIIYLILILNITDSFFNNLWSLSGWSWDAVYKIFPDNGTCFIYYFQSSGTTHASFNCLLPLCSVYRKIFLTFYGLTLILIFFNVSMVIYRIRSIVCQRKLINVWWAFLIVQQSTTSWNTEKKFDRAMKTILNGTVESDLICLNLIPSTNEMNELSKV